MLVATQGSCSGSPEREYRLRGRVDEALRFCYWFGSAQWTPVMDSECHVRGLCEVPWQDQVSQEASWPNTMAYHPLACSLDKMAAHATSFLAANGSHETDALHAARKNPFVNPVRTPGADGNELNGQDTLHWTMKSCAYPRMMIQGRVGLRSHGSFSLISRFRTPEHCLHQPQIPFSVWPRQ